MPTTTLTPITADIPDFTVTPQINTATFPEDIDQYNSELPAVITAQDLLGTQINILIPQLNDLEVNVSELEASTIASSDIAIAAAHFQGTWTGQLTAIPQSWLYNGVVYMVLVAGTDSPITTPSNWFAIGTASSTTYDNTSSGLTADTVQGAIDELQAEKAPKNTPIITGGATISGGLFIDDSIVFEGATPDAFETTVSVTDPTADRTITLPDESGMVALLNSPALTGTPTAPTAAVGTNTTQIATTAFVKAEVTASAVINTGTSVALSGTSVDFTGIPSTAKRITVFFEDLSTNGSSNIQVQLGDAGGVETATYLGSTATTSTVTNWSTGMLVTGASNVAGMVLHGAITIETYDALKWVGRVLTGRSDNNAESKGGGRKTLSATLDRIRITTVNGTDTFDAGRANITWE